MAGIPKPEGLDWVKLHEDMDKIGGLPETTWEKIKKKSKENPLVPLGNLNIFHVTMRMSNVVHTCKYLRLFL